MRYAIQYYARPRAGDLPDFDTIETEFEGLSDAVEQAERDVAPGGPFEWAEAFEIMDYEAFAAGTISDPAVASWRRTQA